MGAFDRSYHDILNRYKQIKEAARAVDYNDEGLIVRAAAAGKTPEQQKAFEDALVSKGVSTPQMDPNIVQGSLDRSLPTTAAAASTKAAPVVTTAPKAPTPQAQSGPATPEEAALLKKFHRSSYNPNSKDDNARLQELRNSAAALGGGDIKKLDANKLRSMSYAQQYKNDPKLGPAYAKQAGPEFSKIQSNGAQSTPPAKAPVSVGPVPSVITGKPGQPTGSGLTINTPFETGTGTPSSGTPPKPEAPAGSNSNAGSGLTINTPFETGTGTPPKPAAPATTEEEEDEEENRLKKPRKHIFS
jgi:hypothetical protein